MNGANEQNTGPVPPTQGPVSEAGGEGPSTPPAEGCRNKAGCMCDAAGVDPLECQFFGPKKPVETFALADFDQAQIVLRQIRECRSIVMALATTLPEAAEIKVQVDLLRITLRSMANKLDAAERGCMQLGLPI